MSNKKVEIALVVVAIIAIAAFARDSKVVVERIVGVEAGPLKTENQEHVGGTTFGLVNSTSTSLATYTMVAGDLGRQGALFDTVLFTKTGAVATSTLTFPASSTLSSVIPLAGQRAKQCWQVATTTAVGVVFVAGTGIDLEQSTTSIPYLTITGGNTGCFDFIRQADSDITGALTTFKAAD